MAKLFRSPKCYGSKTQFAGIAFNIYEEGTYFLALHVYTGGDIPKIASIRLMNGSEVCTVPYVHEIDDFLGLSKFGPSSGPDGFVNGRVFYMPINVLDRNFQHLKEGMCNMTIKFTDPIDLVRVTLDVIKNPDPQVVHSYEVSARQAPQDTEFEFIIPPYTIDIKFSQPIVSEPEYQKGYKHPQAIIVNTKNTVDDLQLLITCVNNLQDRAELFRQEEES